MSKLINGINDLETYCNNNDRRDLLEEWDYKKNNGITPSNVSYGTAKKYWWIGKCGHSYLASVNRRTANKTGCPYCSESHAKLLSGFNDLATTNPEILSSWDYEKNGQLQPNMVMKGQHIKVWWKGACGHSWESTIYHRVQGRGCPICRKESKTSFPEQAIFYYVHKCFPDAESGNKSILQGKELDIYVPSKRVGIEFDGSTWHKDTAKDETKNLLCEKGGIHLYRIRDIDCPPLSQNPFVHIIDFDSYTDDSLVRALNKLALELGVSFDISLENDRAEIYSQFIAQRKNRSLLETNPLLLKEWDYEKNGSLTPELVSSRSGKKVWWKCDKGHEWQAVISSRSKGSGCPFCYGNRLLEGFNDLETINPGILKYWDYDKNTIKPTEVTAHSDKKVWWKCPTCGNSSFGSVSNKAKNPSSCPYCSHKRAIPGKTDLASVKPELAKEWDHQKNAYIAKGSHRSVIPKQTDLASVKPELTLEWDYKKNNIDPNNVTAKSDKKVWWICDKGHSYQSTIGNRMQGKGCPYCSGHKVLVGYNDLAHQFPELAKEWDYEKNDISPTEVTAHSGKKVWWKCSICGNGWQSVVYHRSSGSGCPNCSGNRKKAVLNKDTGVIYASLKDASASCGLKAGDTISLCCLGKQKTAGGFHWEYVEPDSE